MSAVRFMGPDHRGAAPVTQCPVASVGVTVPQHRADLFLDPGSAPREGDPRLGDERATLNEYLRGQRLTLQLKCDGLDAGQPLLVLLLGFSATKY